jgi:hypothetical protein
VTNRRQPRFESNLAKELKDAAEFLRDNFFTSGYRQTKVLDPAVSWRGKDSSRIWGDDPVHPKEEAYSLLAEGAVSVIIGMDSGAKKRPEPTAMRLGSRARAPLSTATTTAGVDRRWPTRGAALAPGVATR